MLCVVLLLLPGTLLVAGIENAQVVAVSAGWYNSAGNHASGNTNYVCGRYSGDDYRNFFVFDLRNVGFIGSAEIRIANKQTVTVPGNSYVLHSVSTPIPKLIAGGVGLKEIFSDLGGGTEYATAEASNSNPYIMAINRDGITAMNNVRGHGSIAFGGKLTGAGTSQHFMFGASQLQPEAVTLVFNSVSSPSPSRSHSRTTSRSQTRSRTATSSKTRSPSVSASSSVTPSASLSASTTPSLSRSSSSTASRTVTPTPSSSPQSVSPTRTSTASRTVTTTPSSSPRSVSPSRSRSRTPSPTRSPRPVPPPPAPPTPPPPVFGRVLVASTGAVAYNADVQSKLRSRFVLVDVFRVDQQTPTLWQLQQYDAVLVYVAPPTVTLGFSSVLVQYVQARGKVLVMNFAFGNIGNYWTTDYQVLTPAAEIKGRAAMGRVTVPNSPIVSGVHSFDGGGWSYRINSASVLPGGTAVAYWTDGTILAAQRFVGEVCRIDLNFFPPSSNVSPDLWVATSDGARLMANSLQYLINNCGKVLPPPTPPPPTPPPPTPRPPTPRPPTPPPFHPPTPPPFHPPTPRPPTPRPPAPPNNATATMPPPESLPSASPPSSSKLVGPIVGGIAGVVALIVVVALLWWKRQPIQDFAHDVQDWLFPRRQLGQHQPLLVADGNDVVNPLFAPTSPSAPPASIDDVPPNQQPLWMTAPMETPAYHRALWPSALAPDALDNRVPGAELEHWGSPTAVDVPPSVAISAVGSEGPVAVAAPAVLVSDPYMPSLVASSPIPHGAPGPNDPAPAMPASGTLAPTPTPPGPLAQPPGALPSAPALVQSPPPTIPSSAPRDEAPTRRQFSIASAELQIGPVVGTGAFGVVHKGTWRGASVAIKMLRRDGMTAASVAQFETEADMIGRLRPHPNVVQFLGLCEIDGTTCIVSSFVAGGSLLTLIQSPAALSQTEKHSLAAGIAAGMLHLHREGVVHRDLAARNILIEGALDGTLTPRITDFGMSREAGLGRSASRTDTDFGPVKWMAPEAISHRQYSAMSDVWSFGVLLFELFARAEPYHDMRLLDVVLGVTGQQLLLPLPADGSIPAEVVDLIRSCMNWDPAARPFFEDIVSRLR